MTGRVRAIVLAAALGLLLLAPATWALQTVGHPTSGTFPAGGPASVATMGGGPGGGGLGRPGAPGGGPPAGAPTFGGAAPQAPPAGAAGALPMARGAAAGAAPGTAMAMPQGAAGAAPGTAMALPQGAASGAAPGTALPMAQGAAAGAAPGTAIPMPQGATGAAPGTAMAMQQGATPGAPGASMFGGDTSSLTAAVSYAEQHGGGTIAVSSQSGAAGSLITSGADVAAIGGFSGRESEVSVAWLADAVRDGRIRWVVTSSGGPGSMRDGRTGSTSAMTAVARSCTAVASVESLYDCSQSANALRAAA